MRLVFPVRTAGRHHLGRLYVDDVNDYIVAAHEIQVSYPDTELVIVPKCREVIDMVPDDIVFGYVKSNGLAITGSVRLHHRAESPLDSRD
jgi:hypothetical protein